MLDELDSEPTPLEELMKEQGQNSKLMASSELIDEGLDILSIISLDDLLDADEIIDESVLESIKNYRDKFRGEDV